MVERAGTRRVTGLTQSDASVIVGISKAGFTQGLVDWDNPPKRLPSGNIDLADFGRWLRERHFAEAGIGRDGESIDYKVEKARLTKAQANKAEVESELAQGSVIESEVVAIYWAGILTNLKTRIMAIGSKIGPRVRAAVSDAEAKAFIDHEANQALTDVVESGIPPAAIERAQNRAQSPGSAAPAETVDDQPVRRRRKVSKPGE